MVRSLIGASTVGYQSSKTSAQAGVDRGWPRLPTIRAASHRPRHPHRVHQPTHRSPGATSPVRRGRRPRRRTRSTRRAFRTRRTRRVQRATPPRRGRRHDPRSPDRTQPGNVPIRIVVRPGFVGGSRPWKRGWSHATSAVTWEADDASVHRVGEGSSNGNGGGLAGNSLVPLNFSRRGADRHRCLGPLCVLAVRIPPV